MRRSILLIGMLAIVSVAFLACSTPAQKAQKLFNAGQYEELVAEFGNDPNLSGLVTDAKEKLAEKLLADGKFEDVLAMYPESKAAAEAKNKLAEALFAAGKYQEVIDKYGDTPAAQHARLAIEKARADSVAAAQPPQKGGKAPAMNSMEKAAQAEYDRIMAIKIDRARTAALQTFVNDAKFAGTAAQKKAQAALSK